MMEPLIISALVRIHWHFGDYLYCKMEYLFLQGDDWLHVTYLLPGKNM